MRLTEVERMMGRGEPSVLATPAGPGLSRSAAVRLRPVRPRGDVSSRAGMLSVRSRPRSAAAHTHNCTLARSRAGVHRFAALL